MLIELGIDTVTASAVAEYLRDALFWVAYKIRMVCAYLLVRLRCWLSKASYVIDFVAVSPVPWALGVASKSFGSLLIVAGIFYWKGFPKERMRYQWCLRETQSQSN